MAGARLAPSGTSSSPEERKHYNANSSCAYAGPGCASDCLQAMLEGQVCKATQDAII